MKVEQVIEVLVETGTGQAKIDVVKKELTGTKVSPDVARKKLAGKIPDVTLERICNIIEHGVPELIRPELLDASNFASKGMIQGLEGTIQKMGDMITKLMITVDDQAGKIAHGRDERQAMAESIDLLFKRIAELEDQVSTPEVKSAPEVKPEGK